MSIKINYPKISFVVPVYNKEPYLADCLNSLIKQSLKDIEIVIVNDASTDRSLKIANWFANTDNRIKIINLKKNVGRSKARNIGNKAATAEIICVQDADDVSLQNRAEITYKAFKRKSFGIFYGSFLVSDAYLNIVDEIKSIDFDFNTVVDKHVTYIGHSTMAYKKEHVTLIKYSTGKWSDLGLDDWKLQIDFYKGGLKFERTSEPLMIYRQITGSVSTVRDAIKVYKAKGNYLKGIE